MLIGKNLWKYIVNVPSKKNVKLKLCKWKFIIFIPSKHLKGKVLLISCFTPKPSSHVFDQKAGGINWIQMFSYTAHKWKMQSWSTKTVSNLQKFSYTMFLHMIRNSKLLKNISTKDFVCAKYTGKKEIEKFCLKYWAPFLKSWERTF